MSHNIKYLTVKENANKAAVKADLDNYVAHEDWQEGCSGLVHDIRWISNIAPLDNEEAAYDYIEKHDLHNYDNLAVRFYEVDQRLVASDKLQELRERKAALEKQLFEKEAVKYTDTVSSTFVGCKNCGSKLKRIFLHKNFCPVCHSDFRSATTIKQINSLDSRLRKASEALSKEEEKLRVKLKKSAVIKWLVKYEYHT